MSEMTNAYGVQRSLHAPPRARKCWNVTRITPARIEFVAGPMYRTEARAMAARLSAKGSQEPAS